LTIGFDGASLPVLFFVIGVQGDVALGSGADVTVTYPSLRRIPFVRWLRGYHRKWLLNDIAAGLVLSAMLAPMGVAYAVASGLPGACGLYATIAPLITYAIFGPSRIMVLGPDSAMIGVILGVVPQLAPDNPAYAVVLASALAIVAGVVCVAAGLVGLGFVTELLSKPIRYGYINGIAFTIVIAQLPKLCGVKIEGGGPLSELWEFAQAIASGKGNAAAFLLGVGTLLIITVLRRRVGIPGALIGVGVATLVVVAWSLDSRAGVSVLGPIPRGLPRFAIPSIRFDHLSAVLAGGCAAALVAFADTSVLSRALAGREKSAVDPNQEMFALGAANLAAGFLQGFPISSSSSRTPVAASAGAKTQMTCVVGAAVIVVLLLVSPPFLNRIPDAALAAIVLMSAFALFDFAELPRLFRIQPSEFWVSMVCFVAVAGLGPVSGIGIAVAIALLEFLWDAWRPHSAILGRVEGIRGFHDVSRHPEALQEPGLVLFRWDAPLFFANAEFFRQRALSAVEGAASPVRWLVVAAEPVTNIDTTAADALVELENALKASGVKCVFAEIKGPVKDKFRRFGLMDLIGESFVFPTIDEAVEAYHASMGAGTRG
jgi:high affinity sulfate transporter 1